MTLETINQKSETRLSSLQPPASGARGYTLVELIISVGLFALIMTLASGAYLVMISITRHTQALSLGIDNLSFALETMTRTIRTGTEYSCAGGDCPSGGTTLTVLDEQNKHVTYTLSNGTITQYTEEDDSTFPVTDPSVTVSELLFYVSGTSASDDIQPHAVIVISGNVESGPGKEIPFSVETSATMRGSDI